MVIFAIKQIYLQFAHIWIHNIVSEPQYLVMLSGQSMLDSFNAIYMLECLHAGVAFLSERNVF